MNVAAGLIWKMDEAVWQQAKEPTPCLPSPQQLERDISIWLGKTSGRRVKTSKDGLRGCLCYVSASAESDSCGGVVCIYHTYEQVLLTTRSSLKFQALLTTSTLIQTSWILECRVGTSDM